MELEQLSYNAIVGAINSHAMPRCYDWIILVVAILTFVASVIVAFFSYKLNKKQSQILEEQNKIALLEKRINIFFSLSFTITSIKNMLSSISEAEAENAHSPKSSNIRLLLQNVLLFLEESPDKYEKLKKDNFLVVAVNDINRLQKILNMIPLIFIIDESIEQDVEILTEIIKYSHEQIGIFSKTYQENMLIPFENINLKFKNFKEAFENSNTLDKLYKQIQTTHYATNEKK